jgi:hypothetical protein
VLSECVSKVSAAGELPTCEKERVNSERISQEMNTMSGSSRSGELLSNPRRVNGFLGFRGGDGVFER